MPVSATDIASIVDLDRYPVDRPGEPAYESLLAAGQTALQERALFSMPGFIRTDAVVEMAAELDRLLPRSCRYDRPRSPWDYGDPQARWPDGHPRASKHPCAYNQVLNYQIGNDSSLRQVYFWEPLADFLRRLCGYQRFFRSECPHLALSSKIAGAGDTDGWHYDSNDVVFSILLQAPEAGGVFEYAPYIRSEFDENYAGIAELFADPGRKALRPAIEPGNLTVFKGDLSMHRVTPVEGERRRIVALFCYDQNPGTNFSQAYIEELEQGLPGQS